MAKRIAELTCPECQKSIQVPFDVKEPPTLEEITNSLNEALKGHPGAGEVEKTIRDQLEGLKPQTEAHRHKTADEFFDCPECFTWVEKTAQHYQVSKKEPAPGPEEQPEPEQRPFATIFGKKEEA